MQRLLAPIGCSGALALVAFIVALVASLFARDVTWTARLGIGAMVAAMTFVAALLLAGRDTYRNASLMSSVRKRLLERGDTSDDEFVASAPSENVTLLLATRKAVASFFEIPTNRVGRDVHLLNDLKADHLAPSFHYVVVRSVLESQGIELQPFTFSTSGLEAIDDLVDSIQAVIDRLDDACDPPVS